jgi:antitoxin MazE
MNADNAALCNYSNYIRGVAMEAKLITIENSKGVRLPKKLIERYHLGEKLTLEEVQDGILINADTPPQKCSWEQTYKEMARDKEDWSDLDACIGGY